MSKNTNSCVLATYVASLHFSHKYTDKLQLRPLYVLTLVLNELAQDHHRLALQPRGLLRSIRKHIAKLPPSSSRLKLERGVASIPISLDTGEGVEREYLEEVLRVMARVKEEGSKGLESIGEEDMTPISEGSGTPSWTPVEENGERVLGMTETVELKNTPEEVVGFQVVEVKDV
jgi:hypothetical protein